MGRFDAVLRDQLSTQVNHTAAISLDAGGRAWILTFFRIFALRETAAGEHGKARVLIKCPVGKRKLALQEG